MPTETTGRVLLVVSVCVVLAAGVAGLDEAGIRLTDESLRLWPLRGAGLAVAIAALGGWLIYRRRRTGHTGAADPVASSIAASILTLSVFAMLAILPPLLGTGGVSRPGAPPPERVGVGGADRRAVDPPIESLGGLGVADPAERPQEEVGRFPESRPEEAMPDRPGPELTILRRGALILALLVVAMVLFGWLRRAFSLAKPSRGFGVNEPSEPPAAREFGEALERSVEDLAVLTTAPRSQITGAYHRLLTVLDRAGVPRRPQEAPHEHLQRALVELGVPDAPMFRLTRLYVFAEFGRGEVGPEHRRAASEALAVSLRTLRKLYPGLEAERPREGTTS